MSCPHGNPIGGCDTCDEVDAAFEAGKRSALAEQPAQQEPVKRELQCICGCSWEIDADGNEELVSSPPAQRTWVGLTQDEFRDFASTLEYGTGGLIRAIEAKLKEKNT